MDSPLSFLEISSKALINNFHELKKYIGNNTLIAAVVKGNAYGHGQKEVVSILKDVIDYFQVDDIEELRLLRKQTGKPALVLGYVAKKDISEALKLGCILSIYDIDRLKVTACEGKRLGIVPKVHIKIDADLGRQGILLTDLESFLIKAKKIKNINIDGVYSHFANIEDTTDPSHALKQIRSFQKAVDIFTKNGFKNFKKHLCATSGIMFDGNIEDNDIARIGIGLYGLWPSDKLRKNLQEKIKLTPALKWVTHIAQVKTLPENFTVGYGLTYKTKKPLKVAIIPQGYADGYDRGLSNIGDVLIKGKRCPVIGRVAMNMFAIDVSKVPNVKTEDEVVLLGSQGKSAITAEEMAKMIGTINYEIVTRISPLLPRIVK